MQMVRYYCCSLLTVFTLLFVQPLNEHVPLPTCNMKVVTITMGRVEYLAKDCGLVTTTLAGLRKSMTQRPSCSWEVNDRQDHMHHLSFPKHLQ